MSFVEATKAALFQGFASFAQLKHIHARLLRLDLHRDHYLLNIMLKSGFHFNRPTYSAAVFGQAHEPNVYLYNTMIRGLASRDCFGQAIEFFFSMRRAGFLPNNNTFPFVLKSCAWNMDGELGASVHSLAVKAGYDDDVFLKTGLVGFYSKLDNLDDARKVFDDIIEKNVVSWSAMMGGYIRARKYREAVDLFMESLETGSRPDSYTLVRALSACAQQGDLNSGRWIHNCVVAMGMGSNVFVNTALVDMYAKCGDMDKARTLFEEMPERDMVTWGAVIQGYAANGLPNEALEFFHRMLAHGLRPDCYVIVGVLSACARLGALQLGERAHAMMEEKEFTKNPVVGTALIDMYAKCGKINAAWEVFAVMRARDIVLFNAIISGLAMTGQARAVLACFGLLQKSHRAVLSMPMQANAVVWGALLGGCRLHRDTRLAEHVLERLIELEPWNSGNYVLLSNLYSVNKKWGESEKIRSVMREKGIQKVSAYSWIEVDGFMHEFLVGDTTHPESGRIYAKLGELGKELREAGYMPTTEYVLFDIDEEEKEHFVGCHSEKLALAFGLISTGDGTVIRIVKNLRVCGDCHEMIKLVSRITGREIVVRDTNRFHHFTGGSCSCEDYW
ncbi:Putative pentatricopeptide repeat-containing protein [Striga hermonthica]|uniref:Pentatricopeptide repeat-containing protein n=1 Tax=Striga hermonthica TaxID=68872 RepID=A0A9N7NJ23_STRHE|nr:Putative pentatricopeptide repeat-containing protein [Striga hermonthica]